MGPLHYFVLLNVVIRHNKTIDEKRQRERGGTLVHMGLHPYQSQSKIVILTIVALLLQINAHSGLSEPEQRISSRAPTTDSDYNITRAERLALQEKDLEPHSLPMLKKGRSLSPQQFWRIVSYQQNRPIIMQKPPQRMALHIWRG